MSKVKIALIQMRSGVDAARNVDDAGAMIREAAANGAPGRVRVVVERYVVTPPTCPDWSKPVGEDSQNSPGANFGCANTANLGMMVANPGDLLRGRNPGPADGTAVSAGIKRYRDGKVRELLEDDRVTAFTGN